MAKHRVVLTPAERKQLQSLLRRSNTTAIQNRRARILLAADVGGDRPVQRRRRGRGHLC
jgi:hypothetical protein